MRPTALASCRAPASLVRADTPIATRVPYVITSPPSSVPGSSISTTSAPGANRRAHASTDSTSGRRDGRPGRAATSSTALASPGGGNARSVSHVKHASGMSASGGSSVTARPDASSVRTYAACSARARSGSIRSRSGCEEIARRNASLGGRMISRTPALSPPAAQLGPNVRHHYGGGNAATLARAVPAWPRTADRWHPARRIPGRRRGARRHRDHAGRPAGSGGLEFYGLVFAGFSLAALVASPIAGRAADRRGPVRPFVLYGTLFIAGSALCGLASSMPLLALARIVQGGGAGGAYTVALAAVTRIYPASSRARVLALLAGAWIVPGLLGPSYGALMAHTLGWAWAIVSLFRLYAYGVDI